MPPTAMAMPTLTVLIMLMIVNPPATPIEKPYNDA